MSEYEIVLVSVSYIGGLLFCLALWTIAENKNSARRRVEREEAARELNNAKSLLAEVRKAVAARTNERDAAYAEVKALKAAAVPKPKRKAKAKAKA